MNNRSYTLAGIAAMDSCCVIGQGGQLPWHVTEDMEHFQATTVGKICLVGHGTLKTFGILPGTREQGLRNRHMVVLTRGQEVRKGKHTSVAGSLEEALEVVIPSLLDKGWHREVMVLGGSSVFWQAQHLMDRVYMTHLHMKVPPREGDAHFPPLNAQWKPISRRWRKSVMALSMEFVVYQQDRVPGTV